MSIQGGVNHKPKIIHGDHLKLYGGTDVVLTPWCDLAEEVGQNDLPERESGMWESYHPQQ